MITTNVTTVDVTPFQETPVEIVVPATVPTTVTVSDDVVTINTTAAQAITLTMAAQQGPAGPVGPVGPMYAPAGTNGQVQYNNNGVSGGFDTTGTDAVVRATGATLTLPIIETPTINTPTIDGLSTFTQTWNNAGTTFTGVLVNITDTASAAASKILDLQVGGVTKFSVDKSGNARLPQYMTLTANIGATAQPTGGASIGNYFNGLALYTTTGLGAVALSSSFRLYTPLSFGSVDDLVLVRGAADTLEQRRGTNAQSLRIYGTYTDASNYERLELGYSPATFKIQTLAAGTGTARGLQLITSSALYLDAPSVFVRAADGTPRFRFTSGGILPEVDNTIQLGTSGFRLATGFFGTSIYSPTFDLSAASGTFGLTISGNTVVLRAGTSGNVLIQTNAVNRWSFAVDGHIQAVTDNVYDLGALDANRPRDIRAARNFYVGNSSAYKFAVDSSNIYANQPWMFLTDNTYDIGTSTAYRPRTVYAGTSVETNRINSGTLLIGLSTGNNHMVVGSAAFAVSSDHFIGWSSTSGNANSGVWDVRLYRGAAGVLDQRNGANAQIHNIYETYTDPSNYARLQIGWNGSNQAILTGALGTGAHRQLQIGTLGSVGLIFVTGGTNRWYVGSGGGLGAVADNTYDIGASGADRPRSVYVGTNIVAGQEIQNGVVGMLQAGLRVGSTAAIGFSTATQGAGGSWDTMMVKDAGGIFAMRFGPTAHGLRIYQSHADASNYSRFGISNSATETTLYTEHLGTGAVRNLWLGTTGNAFVRIQTNGSSRWTFESGGHFTPASASTYNIGSAALPIGQTFASGVQTVYAGYTDSSNNYGSVWSQLGGTVTLTTFFNGTGNGGAQPVLTINSANTIFTTASTGKGWTLATDNSWRPYGTAVDNTLDLGNSGIRVRTGYFGTSVVSPLVSGGSDALRLDGTYLEFRVGGTARWLIDNGPAGVWRPTLDNTYDLGTTSQRVRTGYFGASVVAPTVQSGQIALTANGSVFGYIAPATDISNGIEIQNGTNLSTFRVYATKTDASNYERSSLRYLSTGVTPGFLLTTENAGTGTARDMAISSATGFVRVPGTLVVGQGASAPVLSVQPNSTIAAYNNNASIQIRGTDSVISSLAGYGGATGGTLAGVNLASSTTLTASSGALFLYSNGNDIHLTTDNVSPRLSLRSSGNHVLRGSIEQRDGANPMSVYAYNTYTDASNYERAMFSWGTNELKIGVEASGTGSLRSIGFYGQAWHYRNPAASNNVGASISLASKFFHLYNTNDGTNHDRVGLVISGNYAQLITESGGTGVARHLALRTPASTSVYVGPGGSDKWIFNATGSITAVSDNSYDIGQSAAGRPARVYVGTEVVTSAIKFPATQVASADVNTLDDYEEGTFTPTITLGGAGVGLTYLNQSGTYVKVGRSVQFRMYIRIDQKGSSVGQVLIAGLPFTQEAGIGFTACTINMFGSVGLTGHPIAYIPAGSSGVVLAQGSTAVTTLTDTNVANGTQFMLSGVYFV